MMRSASARVKVFAQPVADKVKGQHRENNRDARKNQDVRRGLQGMIREPKTAGTPFLRREHPPCFDS